MNHQGARGMNPFRVVFKSTAVRLSALYIVLFALCAAFLVFYVTALSERILSQQTRETLEQEAGSYTGAPTSAYSCIRACASSGSILMAVNVFLKSGTRSIASTTRAART